METFTRAEDQADREANYRHYEEVLKRKQAGLPALSLTPEHASGSETDVELDLDEDVEAKGGKY
jgi:hypothetical protein